MRGAWIGNKDDASALRAACENSGRADWRIEIIDANLMYMHDAAFGLLYNNDFIVLPLSLPLYWSLRLPEVANRIGSSCNLILWSRSDANPIALEGLFDAYFTPRSLLVDILVRAEQSTTRETNPTQTDQLIQEIVRSSSVLRVSYDGRPPTLEEIRAEQPPQLTSAEDRVLVSKVDAPLVSIVSHDQDDRWLERLLVHLEPLQKSGNIRLFAKSMVTAGQDHDSVVTEKLWTAQIVIVLVSADLVAMDVSTAGGLLSLVAERRVLGITVIPVTTAPCHHEHLSTLGVFSPGLFTSKPLSLMRKSDAELTLHQVAESVEELARELNAMRQGRGKVGTENTREDHALRDAYVSLAAFLLKRTHGLTR